MKRKAQRLILADTKKVPEGKTVGQLIAEKLKEQGLPTKDNKRA